MHYVSLYFIKDDEKIVFQDLIFKKIGNSWMIESISKLRVPSPSNNLEIINYSIVISTCDGRKCISRIIPVVKNLGDKSAYIWSVQVIISNTTHTYIQSYPTVGKST